MKTKTRRSTKKTPRVKLDAQLAQLEDAQLVRRDGDGEPAYTFKHALTQEAAYESLLHQQQREIHRCVAETYERFYPDRLDEFAAPLAQHYARAGDDAKALTYSIRAGDAAARVYANAVAVEHYTHAIDMAKRVGTTQESPLQESYLKRGRALELLSHFDDAARNYDEMYALGRAQGDRAFELAALIARAMIRAIPGSARDETQGRVFANQALALARELGDRAAQAKILWIFVLLNVFGTGNVLEAIEYGEQSLAIARELGLREQMAYTLNDLMVAYAYRGDLKRARAVRVEASNLWRELDNQPMLAESITGLAFLDFLIGEFDQALSMAQEGFQIGTAISNLGSQGFSGHVLGIVHYERGDLNQAIQSFEEALPITALGGLEGNGLSPHGMLAAIYADLGDFDRAFALVQVVLERPTAQLPLHRMWLYALLTRVDLLSGHLNAAEKAHRDGGIVPSVETLSIMFPPAAPMISFASVDLALARQQYDIAAEVVDSLLTHLQKTRDARVFVPEVLYLQARALRGQSQIDRALAALNEARAEAQAMGSRRMLWKILAAIGEMEAARGNDAAARAARAEARAEVEYIAAHAPEDLRESFLSLRQVRAIFAPEQSK